MEKDVPILHCLEIHLDLLCSLFRARVLTDVDIGCSGGSCEIRLIPCLNQFISQDSQCTGVWYGCLLRDLSASLWTFSHGDRSSFDPRYHLVKLFIIRPAVMFDSRKNKKGCTEPTLLGDPLGFAVFAFPSQGPNRCQYRVFRKVLRKLTDFLSESVYFTG